MDETLYMFDNYIPAKASEYLKASLEVRTQKNPNYSLRAFARDLGLAPSTLSEIMNDKLGLAEARSSKVTDRLQLKDFHREHFIDLLMMMNSNLPSKRTEIGHRIDKRIKSINNIISNDEFNFISDWQYFAILELLELAPNKLTIDEIAKKLGLSLSLCRASMKRLARLNLVSENKGCYTCTTAQTVVGNQTPSLAIQRHHHQILIKAKEALAQQDLSKRDFRTHIFSIRESDITEFKKDLTELSGKLIKKYHQKNNKNEVYCLSTQLFSLEKKDY